MAGMNEQFEILMEELYAMPELLENSDYLREWLLLSSYRSFNGLPSAAAHLPMPITPALPIPCRQTRPQLQQPSHTIAPVEEVREAAAIAVPFLPEPRLHPRVEP